MFHHEEHKRTYCEQGWSYRAPLGLFAQWGTKRPSCISQEIREGYRNRKGCLGFWDTISKTASLEEVYGAAAGEEMNELITLNQNEKPMTTSLLIAEKFSKKHDDVLKSIRKARKDCAKDNISLGLCYERNYKNRGKIYPFFEVDRDFYTLVVMGFRGKDALKFKADYIKQFNRMERQLQQIAIERQSTEWNIARIDGKMQRRKLTDILAPFQIYALNQGSKGTSTNAYSNFSRLVNKAACVKARERNLLTDDMLRRMAHLEGIIEIKVKGLMDDGVYCKEIYQQCKSLMEDFVQMVPYTGTIYLPKSEQIKIAGVA